MFGFLFSVRVVDGQGIWQLLKIMDNTHSCDVHGDFVLLFLVLFALSANTVTVSPNHWIDPLRQNHAQMQKLLKKNVPSSGDCFLNCLH